MSREAKLGILTFIVLVTMIWGYTFLKGRNLLSHSKELFTTYDDVTDLNVSSPILVNGYKIGTVTKIKLNPSNVKKMDVYYLVDGAYKLPKSTVAVLKSTGIMGGKGIFLEFDKECSGNNCIENGDELKGRVVGLLGSMLGEEDMSSYSSELTESARTIIANIGRNGEPGAINETVRQLELISKNIANITASTQQLMNNSSQNLSKTIENLATLSTALARSNQKIESMLANIDKITSDIAKADLKTTIGKTNATLDQSKMAIAELKTTLESTNHTMKDLSAVLQKMDKGDGSMAKLMNDKQLYNNLAATTKNLNLLLQDLRLNPKRYAHFSLFGKKQEKYVKPEDDPANE
ncbi:MAG: MCE family protein [Saprospiraceae bacterium]|nr:MAG: organic solvent resistance ABC transporter periplasmic protein [Bacteroidetes bacterium OLB9]MCO6464054.1 MCE family protein [Saprospiraceae bacterium]